MVARQEAILAAISEKDAHVAVLEMAPNKKTENIEEVEKLTKEKLRLQQVLKDLVSRNTVVICQRLLITSTTHHPFKGLWSRTTRVAWYQKKHSPTYTHPDHSNCTIFINLL